MNELSLSDNKHLSTLAAGSSRGDRKVFRKRAEGMLIRMQTTSY